MATNSSHYVKDSETPEWATFALVRYVITPEHDIDEVVSFAPSAPASVALKVSKEFEDETNLDSILHSLHATELWMQKRGMPLEFTVCEDFDIWVEDIAGFMLVVEEDELGEVVPLESVQTIQEL